MPGDQHVFLALFASVTDQCEGQSVFVVKNGKAKQVEIEIGERTEENVQIISNIIIENNVD